MDIAKYLSFWDKLTPEQQRRIKSNTRKVHYLKNEHIHQGEFDCIGVIAIINGGFRVYILSEDGREVTLFRLSQGDICMLSASCIFEDITFDVYIDAIEDSDAYIIDSNIFKQIRDENVYVENSSYKIATERFSDVMWAIQNILFLSLDKRLALFLLDEYERNNNTNINLTHEQIANYIGSAREAVSRMLKSFERDNIVTLYRGGLTIKDLSKLKEFI